MDTALYVLHDLLYEGLVVDVAVLATLHSGMKCGNSCPFLKAQFFSLKYVSIPKKGQQEP